MAAAGETVEQDRRNGMQTVEDGVGSFFHWTTSGYRRLIQIFSAGHAASHHKYVDAWRPSFGFVAASAFAAGLVVVGVSSVYSWRRGK